ncbi:N(4)-(Beta-N-acetylglucosaminyl)-L-asparaginase [Gracilariopsis chorda]|uniref:N(4)-(Beta-N-acetylglucosaminyl)-L-asparaginase n=1 Tax=Gracilariopsis chorda TaxID=448386 RepID=A0A2V3IK87_9FLOR|nr:N(4)-(Beta-N-acetylglucosaminyl)-L-asparaginase [Gracilariopsis chorda]|eukprot:PXF42492.1 N(4)-(Beta-N-acetylglucosaminyl)-L-asparaginase [Gracilariopsis chorda]
MASLISTWRFSQCGVDAAAVALSSSCSSTEAVEIGVKTVELDESVTSAGYGGLPNAEGVLQLDAAIMTSSGRIGSVMALTGYKSSIDIAHAVLQHSRHPILVGDGAALFAQQRGFQNTEDLLTPHAYLRYHEFLASKSSEPEYHRNDGMTHSDTVGMIARDSSGAITAGCATSGMQFKSVGRVGDSPIVGAGLFASGSGAAVASGDGDKLIRFCLAFLTVERMKTGHSAIEACRHTISRVKAVDPTCQAAIAAMSADGEVGAASTHDGFNVVVWRDGMKHSEIRPVKGETDIRWIHTCV